MRFREVNLLGGFYKDASLPWSSQDTVNWLPVPAQAEGTRSPMKLRGVPGLRSLDESVLLILRINGNSPDGIVGDPYSFTYTASGGTAPYTFSFVSGSLPAGLSFSGGAISGTPTTVESDSYRVRVTDAEGRTVDKDDQIAITLEAPTEVSAIPPDVGVLTSWNTAIGDTFSGTNTPPRAFAYWGLNEILSTPVGGDQQYRLIINGADRLTTPVFPTGADFPRVYYRIAIEPGDVISCVSIASGQRVGFIATSNT